MSHGADRVRRVTDDGAHPGSIGFDHVSVNDLSIGDWVLLRPGERVPQDGVLVAVVPERDDAHAQWCTVETGTGDRQLRAPGGALSASETVRGPSVIVEIRRPTPSWWLHLWTLFIPGGSPGIGRQIALIALLFLTVTTTGFGIVGDQPLDALDIGGEDDHPDHARSGITYHVSPPGNAFDGTDTELEFELSRTSDDWVGGGNAPDYGDGDPSNGASPGTNWTNRLTVTNTGNVPGEITLRNVTLVSYENGLTESEIAVDDTGGDPGRGAGELANVLEVKISVIDRNGSRTHVFGDERSYRTLRSLDDQRVPVAMLRPNETVLFVVEYRIPPTVGNEIQSDSVAIDFGFTILEVG